MIGLQLGMRANQEVGQDAFPWAAAVAVLAKQSAGRQRRGQRDGTISNAETCQCAAEERFVLTPLRKRDSVPQKQFLIS